jgi:HK97 gp10 family phage protein
MASATIRGSLAGKVRALKETVSESTLRSAAHAGAVVLYDEMKLRAPVDQGTLRDSIYRWHDDSFSKDGRQRYVIGPNKRKAPHWHLVEYGHWRVNVVVRLPNGQIVATKERLQDPVWVPAVPYIRSAFDAKVHSAIAAAKARLGEGIEAALSSADSTRSTGNGR